ncbi:MAG: flagellar protein FlaG [Deltaproteobacteria bacterium]|nr:flagellar protein FlaG [Deltaproteobacteria bacterium]
MNLIELSSAVMGSPPEKSTTGRTADRPAPRTASTQNIMEIPSITQSEVQKKDSEQPATKALTAAQIQKIEETAKDIQKFLDANGRELNFYVNHKNGQVVIEVHRKSDGKLIRKIPPEDLLKPQNGPSMSGLLLEEDV